jgi:predicted nucleotide-binding protein
MPVIRVKRTFRSGTALSVLARTGEARTKNLRLEEFPSGKIEDAERSTNCGIFLFMEDDVIGNGKNREFAPRDNVVFEAGYFAGAKRMSRSLAIREKNAKVPSDFGGILYLELPSRKSIAAVESKLTDHIGRTLNRAD